MLGEGIVNKQPQILLGGQFVYPESEQQQSTKTCDNVQDTSMQVANKGGRYSEEVVGSAGVQSTTGGTQKVSIVSDGVSVGSVFVSVDATLVDLITQKPENEEPIIIMGRKGRGGGEICEEEGERKGEPETTDGSETEKRREGQKGKYFVQEVKGESRRWVCG